MKEKGRKGEANSESSEGRERERERPCWEERKEGRPQSNGKKKEELEKETFLLLLSPGLKGKLLG